jgi:hypothetical protein
MTDLDLINTRLTAIETMLRQLLNQQPAARPVQQTASIMAEIAQVKAGGGDLKEYYRQKAKSEQQRERRKKC